MGVVAEVAGESVSLWLGGPGLLTAWLRYWSRKAFDGSTGPRARLCKLAAPGLHHPGSPGSRRGGVGLEPSRSVKCVVSPRNRLCGCRPLMKGMLLNP